MIFALQVFGSQKLHAFGFIFTIAWSHVFGACSVYHVDNLFSLPRFFQENQRLSQCQSSLLEIPMAFSFVVHSLFTLSLLLPIPSMSSTYHLYRQEKTLFSIPCSEPSFLLLPKTACFVGSNQLTGIMPASLRIFYNVMLFLSTSTSRTIVYIPIPSLIL